MKNISDISERIVKFFNNHVECLTDEEHCPDSLQYVGDIVVVGDDNNREQWVVELKVKDGTHQTVTTGLTTLFGEPEKVSRGNGTTVNNWKKDHVHIIQVDDQMTLLEDYEKVSSGDDEDEEDDE